MKHLLLSFLLSLLVVQTIKAGEPLIKTVEIPAGRFFMGSKGEGENYDEAPIHEVVLTSAFRMGITEVTNK